MTGIIAITVAESTAITITLLLRNIRLNSRLKSKKGEPGGSPFCHFAVSSRKRARSTYVSRATRTARAVCSALVQL